MPAIRENVVRLLCAVDISVLLDGDEPAFRNGDPITEFESKTLGSATASELGEAIRRIGVAVNQYNGWLAEFDDLKRRLFDGLPAETTVGDLEQTDDVRRLHEVHTLLEESPVNDWDSGRDGLDKWAS